MPYWEANMPDEWKKHGAEIPEENIIGFRTPFQAYSDYTFQALLNQEFVYDCSIEEGVQSNQDGSNYYWPYTLDNGSPAAPNIGNHPGLWEMGCHLVVKPDGSKMTGLDYNMWVDAKMSKTEFVNTLKHTLDLRLQGNRCPFLFGAHSDEYSSKWTGQCVANIQERREALVEFFEYALTKPDVRIVSYDKVLAWIREPAPLDGTGMYMTKENAVKPIVGIYHNTVFINDLNEGTLEFDLYTLQGSRVVAETVGVETNRVEVNLTSVPSGVYVIRFKGMPKMLKRITIAH